SAQKIVLLRCGLECAAPEPDPMPPHWPLTYRDGPRISVEKNGAPCAVGECARKKAEHKDCRGTLRRVLPSVDSHNGAIAEHRWRPCHEINLGPRHGSGCARDE